MDRLAVPARRYESGKVIYSSKYFLGGYLVCVQADGSAAVAGRSRHFVFIWNVSQTHSLSLALSVCHEAPLLTVFSTVETSLSALSQIYLLFKLCNPSLRRVFGPSGIVSCLLGPPGQGSSETLNRDSGAKQPPSIVAVFRRKNVG
jgi:hypothetical protein